MVLSRLRKKSPKLGRVHKKTQLRQRHLDRALLIFSFICLAGGLYLIFLLIAPGLGPKIVKSQTDLNVANDISDQRDRIQIQKINLEAPFFTGEADVLERGVWHRYPDRGDPQKGGNFILSAHRFKIAGDPVLTKERSPFYNLDKLEVGDTIRIFYDGEWYEYRVEKTYSVRPEAVEIEDPSSEAKLTLYSCTLGGSTDGRIVIEAKKV